eukprot:5765220-Karenia_brevis.AAC.1
MAMFWEAHKIDWGLQSWNDSKSRGFCLEGNMRSGADVWCDASLEQAISGTLSEDNYNFLHGFSCCTDSQSMSTILV